MDVIVFILVMAFVLGLISALRHVIAHVILFCLALYAIGYSASAPDHSGWWAALGLMMLLGQFGMAKEALIDKPKAQRKLADIQRRRAEAEDYILSSGDPEAIKLLMLARANPANYSQVLSGGMNRGNSTLKTALGVMTGVVVGNMISDSITESMISDSLNDAQSEFDATDSDLYAAEADSDFDAAGDDIDFT